MADFAHAINLIRKYEGFNERAYADPATGAEPYTIGFGTQYYPDGSPVKKGQRCSKEKALEYLFHEVSIIDTELQKLNLGLDDPMRQALISFVHSIGWEPFLYSEIVDAIEQEDFKVASDCMSRWIFDEYHRVIGSLIDRRREEVNLFLKEIDANPWSSTEILLTAFRNYSGAPHQVRAVRQLEENVNPYVLSEFANTFCIDEDPWAYVPSNDYGSVFDD
jgi:GH24 family phage-related lysozyme (muramidase)